MSDPSFDHIDFGEGYVEGDVVGLAPLNIEIETVTVEPRHRRLKEGWTVEIHEGEVEWLTDPVPLMEFIGGVRDLEQCREISDG